ncbi:hypothetical protein [Nocardioides insulae]|uniref:hypothetical protein n=1 Tax=Nocardioides insulae TaxID=394734 RepID=UPI0004137487|nr:hypothetical protein [Nocardioides insulae]
MPERSCDLPGGGSNAIPGLLAAYARRTPVRSVAVVGNAPLTPSDERADAIDGCDLVIRVNSFMLDEPGAPRTQGREVHAVVFSRGLLATPFSYAAYTDAAYLVTEPSRIYYGRPLARYVKDWPRWWPDDLGYLAVPNHAFTVPLLEELGEPWKDEVCVPTTGMMALWIGRNSFPGAELVFTGFSMVDDPHQTEWRHQAGDVSPIGGAHHIGPEGELMRRWIDEGEARFLR